MLSRILARSSCRREGDMRVMIPRTGSRRTRRKCRFHSTAASSATVSASARTTWMVEPSGPVCMVAVSFTRREPARKFALAVCAAAPGVSTRAPPGRSPLSSPCAVVPGHGRASSAITGRRHAIRWRTISTCFEGSSQMPSMTDSAAGCIPARNADRDPGDAQRRRFTQRAAAVVRLGR